MFKVAIKKTIKFFLELILNIFGVLHRFRFVHFYTSRIGHLCLNTEVFLRKLQTGEYDRNITYYLIPDDIIANSFLYSKYLNYFNTNGKFKIRVIENKILKKMLRILFGFKSNFVLPLIMNSNENNLFISTDKSLNFTHEEYVKGKEILYKMGINDWYVCVYARDDLYLNSIEKNNLDLSYHNFRNCDINTYEEAIKYIISIGGSVIRVGNIAKEKLTYQHEKLIDYPFTKYVSDFMDIYLIANAKFILASTSGATDVCSCFQVPRAGVNWVPYDHMPWTSKYDIGLVKKLHANGQYVSLERYLELVKNGIIRPFDGNSYKSANINIEDNSAEEIKNVCEEMYLKLENKLNISQNDVSNQNRYKEIHKKSELFGQVNTDMSYAFLRKNEWFLES